MGKVGEKLTYATSALLTLDPGRLVLPRPRCQLLAAGDCPRDVVVGSGRVKVAIPTFAVVKKSGR